MRGRGGVQQKQWLEEEKFPLSRRKGKSPNEGRFAEGGALARGGEKTGGGGNFKEEKGKAEGNEANLLEWGKMGYSRPDFWVEKKSCREGKPTKREGVKKKERGERVMAVLQVTR